MKYTKSALPIQGTAKKTLSRSPLRRLNYLFSQHQSGSLTFRNPQNPQVAWRIHFGDRHIHFVESLHRHPSRLAYLLQSYAPQCQWPEGSNSIAADYDMLYKLLQKQQLSLNQFRDLLTHVTQEALSHLLAIANAEITFDPQVQIDPICLSMPLWKLTWPIEPRIAQWALMHPEIPSAFHQPFIKDWDKFIGCLGYFRADCCRLSQFTAALKQNLNLYQLASHFNIQVEDLAASIHPLLKYGAVGVNLESTSPVLGRTKVACIDQNPDVQSAVQRILSASGYDVVPIVDTTRVFSALAQHRPAAILLNRHLPQMDGYTLCRLLKRVEALKDLPIVMLNNQNSLIEDMRTKLCGSMASLSKPIQPQELQALMQQLLPHHPRRTSSIGSIS